MICGKPWCLPDLSFWGLCLLIRAAGGLPKEAKEEEVLKAIWSI